MRFSIVTPSYNQSHFLRSTMESVLSQQVDLEYLVMDGDSSDGSREIIKEYAEKLSYWCSEPDGGQYEAINKGFARSTGEIMGWLNSSDLYLPWTLPTVELIFKTFPEISWMTSQMKTCITEQGTYEDLWITPGFSARRFYRGLHGGPGNSEYLQQESCFWRRSLWEKIGGAIDLHHASAGDYWLWSQFFRHDNVAAVEAPLAAFRFHDEAKSVQSRYEKEVAAITREMQQEPKEAYPDGSLSVVRWRAAESGASAITQWKLERRKNNSFLDARTATEHLIRKTRWPLTKSLQGLYQLLKKN
jgi:glycosyltransferase involved in cell wall biosynthesis